MKSVIAICFYYLEILFQIRGITKNHLILIFMVQSVLKRPHCWSISNLEYSGIESKANDFSRNNQHELKFTFCFENWFNYQFKLID
ncbi:hypothetical protein BLOT_008269 [Blomia tropicalis]|nr:hypothetical protein BLOT_008269 [Blomia tropicalis]